MKLSVIVPTYKKPKSLSRCLESIEKCCKNIEVIVVVDDGAEYKELKNKFNKYRFIYLGNGTGFTMAVWKGVLVSTGDIVGVIGDDVEFITEGIDNIIIDSFNKRKENDYVLGLNDGIIQRKGSAHPFMLKSYWVSGGGFPPCYRHFCGDIELCKLALYHKKWVFLDNAKILHHHWYAKKVNVQGVIPFEENVNYNRGISKGGHDKLTERLLWWRKNGMPRTIPYSV